MIHPMTEEIDVPQMMGSAEVAATLGVQGQNLQHVRGLPEPVQKIRATRLWLAKDIYEFAESRRRARREVVA